MNIIIDEQTGLYEIHLDDHIVITRDLDKTLDRIRRDEIESEDGQNDS
jgi:hypothetical protein